MLSFPLLHPADSDTPGSVEYNLLPVDLDIVHPATGELDEGKEDSGDATYVVPGRGGLVALKRDENTPKTKLVLRACPSLPSDSKFRIKTDIRLWTGSLKVWKDQAGTQAVVSGQTEFPANVETTLYLEGEKRTVTDDLVITQQVKVGSNWVDGDKVSTTVVHAEIPIVIRAFIPHKWTEGETPLPPPLHDEVVEGDRQNFSLKDYPDADEPAYRMAQMTVLTPFKELHSPLDITNERKDKAAPGSHYYEKATDVPAADQSKTFGESFVAGATADHTYVPQITDRQYKDGQRYQDSGRPISAITIICSGEPGMPFFVPSALTPNIDWKYVVKIDTNYPHSLTAKVAAEHNLYPSYEVIIGQSDGTFVPLWQYKPAASILPGPSSLNSTVTGNGNDVPFK